LLNPKSKPAQYLKDLPIDRWLLETDAQAEIGIDQIYSCAARILGWELDALHQQMIKNFERILIND
jgi:Tat protein secretion system quality control protein TatD with DNase activity